VIFEFMNPLPILATLLTLTALAEPRTLTLVTKAGWGDKRVEIPANHSAEIVSFGPSTFPPQVHKDGTVLDFGIGSAARTTERLIFAGPAMILLPEPGAGSAVAPWVSVRLTPETFDASKALVIGPTTNMVIVSYQSSSNLVDWTTVTDQVFQGVPSAQFFRVTASPTVTP
jgi:hypothetical protein